MTEGRFRPELQALAPEGERRMGANPHANGGLLLKDLSLPNFRDYAVSVPEPGRAEAEDTRVLGAYLRDVVRKNMRNFRIWGPDETLSNRLNAVFRGFFASVGCGDDRAGRRIPRDGGQDHGSAQRALSARGGSKGTC